MAREKIITTIDTIGHLEEKRVHYLRIKSRDLFKRSNKILYNKAVNLIA